MNEQNRKRKQLVKIEKLSSLRTKSKGSVKAKRVRNKRQEKQSSRAVCKIIKSKEFQCVNMSRVVLVYSPPNRTYLSTVEKEIKFKSVVVETTPGTS